MLKWQGLIMNTFAQSPTQSQFGSSTEQTPSNQDGHKRQERDGNAAQQALTWSIACMEKLNVMNSQMGLRPAFEKQKNMDHKCFILHGVGGGGGEGHGTVKKQEEQLHLDDSRSNAKPEEKKSLIFLKYTSVTQSILGTIFLMYVL